MATCPLTTGLGIGPNAFFFSKQHELFPREYRFRRSFGRRREVIATHREAVKRYGQVYENVDIHTPFDALLPENIVVHVGFGEIQQPYGRSCGWWVDTEDIRVLDRAEGASIFKTIRIRCRLYTWGNVQTQIRRLHLFGFALRGQVERSFDLDSSEGPATPATSTSFHNQLRAGNTVLFSLQQDQRSGGPIDVPVSLPGLACEEALACIGFGNMRGEGRPTTILDVKLLSQEDRPSGPRFLHELQKGGGWHTKDGDIFRVHAFGVAATGGRAFPSPTRFGITATTAPAPLSDAVVFRDRFLIFRTEVDGDFRRGATHHRVLELKTPFSNLGSDAVVHVGFGKLANPFAGAHRKHWDVQIQGVDVSAPPVLRIFFSVRCAHSATRVERLHFFGVVRNASASAHSGFGPSNG